MIKKINIENFKSWQEFPNTDLGKLTGFFGTNSSGKTSILDFILLIKQTIESTDRSQPLNTGSQNSYTELGSFDELIHKHNPEKELKFGVELEFDKNISILDPELRKKNLFKSKTMGFHASIMQNKKKRLFVNRLSYSFAQNVFEMRKQEADRYDYSLSSESIDDTKPYKLKRTTGRVWPLPEPIKFHGFPDQVRSYYQNAGFLFDFQLQFEEYFKNVYYLGPLRDYPQRQYTWAGSQPDDMGQRGERCIDALLSSRLRNIRISPGYKKKKRTVEEYVAYWLKELGLIHSFNIVEVAPGTNIYQVKVKRNQNSSEVLITDVGFGVSQILPVLTLCYYVPEGSTLLIEQPEIHLHPKVQAGLADVFIDAIKVKKIQIIVESHSEHLLRRFQRRIAEEEIDNTDIKAFFCDNDGSKSILKPLDVDLYGNITNWPDNFFGDEMGEFAAITRAIRKRKNEK